MSELEIKGNISLVIGENGEILKVKLKPDRKYISPDAKYAICFGFNTKEKTAKLLELKDNYLNCKVAEGLEDNNFLQNIALQKLSAVFHIEPKEDKSKEDEPEKTEHKITGFEYPSTL